MIHMSDASAASAVTKRKRLAGLTEMFERFGVNGMAAEVRARATYLVQIGHISMQTHEDLDLRMSRMSEYLHVYTGVVPEPREMARFYSRHGYDPAKVSA